MTETIRCFPIHRRRAAKMVRRLARRNKRHAAEIDRPAPDSDPPRITSTIAKKKKALPPASDAEPSA